MGNKTLQELIELYASNPIDALRNSIISKSMPLIRSAVVKLVVLISHYLKEKI